MSGEAKKMLLISPEFLSRICDTSNSERKQKEIKQALSKSGVSDQKWAEVANLIQQYQKYISQEREELQIPVIETNEAENPPSVKKTAQQTAAYFSTPIRQRRTTPVWETLTPLSTRRREKSKPGPNLARYRPRSQLKKPDKLNYK